MTRIPDMPLPAPWRQRVDRIATQRPDWALMAPYMVYLLLLTLRDQLPSQWNALASAIRGLGALAIAWLLWKHYPPFGRAHWPLAIVAGGLSAAGWVVGQHLFDHLGVPRRLPLPPFSGEPAVIDPRSVLGEGALFWSTACLRIVVACTTVPIVEELFWRAFLLRALIHWAEFEKVPLGTFTWFSFLGTALLSAIQHPDNWTVSILCWMAWNGLCYWKRSILLLIITHAVTNLVLYVYVVAAGDWRFW